MNVDSEIFKAYDIRGTYPDQLNDDVAFAIGKLAPSVTAPKKTRPKIVVGSDARLSSPSLKQALIKGLLESGADVDDIGLVSTPTFYLIAARYRYDGGIQVSASHNPKNWNGFKVVSKQAVPIGFKNGLDRILETIKEDRLPSPAAERGIQKNASDLQTKALEALATEVTVRGGILPFKIVFDGGNGMGGLDMKSLFMHLPCQIVWMNEKPDGTFPAHPPDPLVAENTKDLRTRVVAEHADLGIASDGDGDRYFFFDEKGEVVPPEIVRGLMAKIELKKHPGATIVYDVRPGKITKDLIEQAGGIPVLAPVGHSLIKEKMIQVSSVFGGESSGHFFYQLPIGTFEVPLMLVCNFLRFISEEKKPVSEIVRGHKRYYNSGEINIPLYTREEGLKKIEMLTQKYASGRQITIDGLTVEYDDVTFSVRLSNTEPLIRLIVESSNKETMEQKKEEIWKLLTAN